MPQVIDNGQLGARSASIDRELGLDAPGSLQFGWVWRTPPLLRLPPLGGDVDGALGAERTASVGAQSSACQGILSGDARMRNQAQRNPVLTRPKTRLAAPASPWLARPVSPVTEWPGSMPWPGAAERRSAGDHGRRSGHLAYQGSPRLKSDAHRLRHDRMGLLGFEA